MLTIGFGLASPDIHYESFLSKISLLDWDIVLFKPQIDDLYDYDEDLELTLIGDATSELKESCEHWSREINQAVETGKTVIVFLPGIEKIYEHNNYQAIPATLSPVKTSGSSMKLSAQYADLLASYWAEFERVSRYEAILTNPEVPACIVTRTGDKAVGALYRSEASAGTLLLLPDIDFNKINGDGQTQTRAAKQFAGRMVSTIVALDKALRTSAEVTPEPAWATEPRFALGTESSLRVQLLEAERKVGEAQKQKEQIVKELRSAGTYRGLLFEKGKALENVIIEALRLLGEHAQCVE